MGCERGKENNGMGEDRKEREGRRGIGSKIIGTEMGGRRDVNDFQKAAMRMKRKFQEEKSNRGSARQLGITSTVKRRNR
jgi:hypothetical protein